MSRLPTVPYSLFRTHCSSLIGVHCSLLTTHCSLFLTHCSVRTAHHALLITHWRPHSLCASLTAHHSLTTAGRGPSRRRVLRQGQPAAHALRRTAAQGTAAPVDVCPPCLGHTDQPAPMHLPEAQGVASSLLRKARRPALNVLTEPQPCRVSCAPYVPGAQGRSPRGHTVHVQ